MRRGWTITDITRTKADGTEYVQITCPKCGGSGYIRGYEFIDEARCWECRTVGASWITREEADRVTRRREQAAARARRKAEEAAAAYAAKVAEWRAANADVIAALEALTDARGFLAEMRDTVVGGGMLTDGQTAATAKAIADAAEKAATETDAPEGRVDVVGTVLSLKEVVDTYSYYERYITKVVVDCGAFRLYGTLPAALSGVTRGDRVAFTATVTPKERGFGIFKRPSKARVVDA